MDLFEAGFKHITNVDYSNVLIVDRQRRFPEMQWICDDIGQLRTIEDGAFDVVIEKAVLDCLLSTEKSPWSLSVEGNTAINGTLEAIERVLRPDGLFLSISFAQPHFRLPLLLRGRWSVEVKQFGTGFGYWLYAMQRGQRPDMATLDRYLYAARSREEVELELNSNCLVRNNSQKGF